MKLLLNYHFPVSAGALISLYNRLINISIIILPQNNLFECYFNNLINLPVFNELDKLENICLEFKNYCSWKINRRCKVAFFLLGHIPRKGFTVCKWINFQLWRTHLCCKNNYLISAHDWHVIISFDSRQYYITEEVMYDFLSKYLMSEEDLVENGYPRPCPSAPGKAVFKSRKEQPSKDCKLLHSWSRGIYML